MIDKQCKYNLNEEQCKCNVEINFVLLYIDCMKNTKNIDYLNTLSKSKRALLNSIYINGNEVRVGNKRIVLGEFVEFQHDKYKYVYNLRTRKYKKIICENDVKIGKSEGHEM